MSFSAMMVQLTNGFGQTVLIFVLTLLFSMLDFIGVENGRTRVEWVSAAEGVKFSQTMNEFAEKIHSLGKNVRLEDLRCRKN